MQKRCSVICILGGAEAKNLPANTRDAREVGSIPASGRSPGGENGNQLRYSSWKIPWTEEFGRLQSRGSEESDMNEQLSTTQQRQIIEVETEVCTYAETQGENNVSHMHRTQENIMDSLVTRIVEHSWNSDSF